MGVAFNRIYNILIEINKIGVSSISFVHTTLLMLTASMYIIIIKLKTKKTVVLNKRTCCIICLNCSSMGEQSAEMTGSLCRHTAAIRFHGELALSVALLVCRVNRRMEVQEKLRKPWSLAAVLLKQDKSCMTDLLAILLQGAAIFFCCVQHTRTKIRDVWYYTWQCSSVIFKHVFNTKTVNRI